jgi:hypothetical protein
MPKQAATGDASNAGDAAQSEKLANLMGATGLDVVRLSIRWRSRDYTHADHTHATKS